MPSRPPNAPSYARSFGAPVDDGALVAVLGPTNTGKTYFAIERLLAHRSGMIGLPLRLLAREVYDKLIARVDPREVALVTGEEKIIPPNPRFWVSTVEAMPLEQSVEFLAIDEIQLAADMERGRIFTSRLLNARGTKETIFLGAHSMARILRRLYPGIEILTRERFSALTYAGQKKVTRLPRRSAIVGFSADTVYAIAELVRRQRGGAAVVLGALSPRTRNAQAELYQSGEVDYLVATDAIGMGLNMDIDHVAFSARRKFDGRRSRDLRPDELAQIAGRAGRHVKNGSFGVTADCPVFDDEIAKAIEDHEFPSVDALQWRSDILDFSSLATIRQSLDTPSANEVLKRARPGEDERALDRLIALPEIRERATSPARVSLLWDVCQTPDFRKSAFDHHARLLGEIYEQLIDDGRIGERWLAPKVDQLYRVDGDIDAISTRIAHIRSWTYLANRTQWMENATYWQAKTRSIEDALSDALHEKLTQRFVDRRTSVLLKKLRDDAPLLAGVTEDGDVIVEGQFVGRLLGFEFILDPRAKGVEAKRVRAAAEKALTPVLAARAAALANAETQELSLEKDGTIRWRTSTVARLEKGPTPFRPNLVMRGLDVITPSLRGRVQDRLTDFLAARIEALLGDLLQLKAAADSSEAKGNNDGGDKGGEKTDEKTDETAGEATSETSSEAATAPTGQKADTGVNGLARGIAFRLVENFGAMSRAPIAADLKKLQQEDRAKLRKIGVRFGEFTLHMPSLLKPAPARLLTMLWALWADKTPGDFDPPKAGLVSLPLDNDLPHAYYYASGYRPSGERAVRIDMLERLAGLVRTAREAPGGREGFEATSQMMSIVGCSGEEFESILRSLGFRKQTVKRPKPKPVEENAAAQATPPAPAPNGKAVNEPGHDAPGNAAEKAVDDPNTAQQGETNAAPADQSVTADNTAVAATETPIAADDTPTEYATPDPMPVADIGSNASEPTETGENGTTSPEGARNEDQAQQSTAPNDDVSSAAPTAPDTPQEDDLVEVTLWRMQPRRPQNQNRRPRSQDQGDQKDGQKPGHKRQDNNNRNRDGRRGGDFKEGGPRGKGRPPQKGKHGKGGKGPQAPRRYESGPKRTKGPDPDSPFAVLAALKQDGDKSE